jgi:hypothetical protein
MPRIYKSFPIQRALQGGWIVTYKDNSHSIHRTLEDARAAINMTIGA